MRTSRLLGVPLLFGAAASAVGFSVYFSLGVVADRGLGLTPLIFLGAGLMFALTTMTYVEGGAMFRERGGSSMFASRAFNELISFVAGWAILIDYLIVIAAAAITVPHYLSPIAEGLSNGGAELAIAGAVILLAAAINVVGVTGRTRQARLVVLALADLALQVAVIGVGAIVVFEPSLLTDQLDLFSSPSGEDVIYAFVIATIAYAGIEAASDLAPDVDFEPGDLRRVLNAGAIVVPLLYACISAVALMALPVRPGPDGPETELATTHIEEPVLGVVQAFDPAWLGDVMQWFVMLVAVPMLIWAASTSMMGVSRHVYALARSRQIPSWAGKLERSYSTPYIAIGMAALLALGLAIPGDITFLAGVYAFGALLATTIAHLSIVRLRFKAPDRERPYSVPFNVTLRGRSVPLPALGAGIVSGAAWVSVLAYHGQALYVGGGWMAFGLVSYLLYRRLEGISITERVVVPEGALKKQTRDIEYSSILVPVFGTELDDDIVSTAGRLADASVAPGGAAPRLEVVFIAELPLTVPLDAPLPKDVLERGTRTLRRAEEVAGEYENVEVGGELVPARTVGAGIVSEARRHDAELIVMGAESPSRVRGGAILGGIGAARPDEIGEVTEYVLRRAPCRVLVTAPPEDRVPDEEDGEPQEGEPGRPAAERPL
ncbi:MAG: amino acid permease [Solirubrobacterales bacterium]